MEFGGSSVMLPAQVGDDYEVYVNGVCQQEGADFQAEGRRLLFARTLRRDRISRWRWFLGAWGVGTYRQDDVVDVRYELAGEPRVAHALPIAQAPEGDPSRPT